MEHLAGDEPLDVALDLEEERDVARPVERNLQEGLPVSLNGPAAAMLAGRTRPLDPSPPLGRKAQVSGRKKVACAARRSRVMGTWNASRFAWLNQPQSRSEGIGAISARFERF